MSSGERKRMMAKPCACDTRQGLRAWCCGALLLLFCRRAVRVRAGSRSVWDGVA